MNSCVIESKNEGENRGEEYASKKIVHAFLSQMALGRFHKCQLPIYKCVERRAPFEQSCALVCSCYLTCFFNFLSSYIVTAHKGAVLLLVPAIRDNMGEI